MFSADGQPIERGVPAKAEVPATVPEPVASEPELSATPVIRPAYLKPDTKVASLRSGCGGSGTPQCASGRSTNVRVNVFVKDRVEEKPKTPRFRIGRRR